MRKSSKSNKTIFQSLVMVSQFGINMLVPICLMVWLGMWLDERFQTSWLTILCFFIGAIAGFQNIYRMSGSFMHSEREYSRELPDADAGKPETDKETE